MVTTRWQARTLHFDVKIISSREATPEELERGHMFESHGGAIQMVDAVKYFLAD